MATVGANRAAYGTLTSNTSTDTVVATQWVTCSAHIDSGTGTITWEFKGPDGVWRTLYGGADNTTAQAYTASHVVTFEFGDDVEVRGTVSSASSLQLDYQIFSNLRNRN